MMFSTNPYPHLTSTIQDFPPSTSFLDHEKEDLYNHHRSNHPLVAGDCFPARVEGLGLEQCDEYNHNHLLWSEEKNIKLSKKDHHSKIHTAQGPRDRRVRLSIEIAKKFFYLQDLLGFDKASKTLDWLFSQSKIPINELVQSKKQSSSSSVSDQSEVVFGETVKGEKKKKNVEGKRKKITRKYKSGSPVNQSRVEARARARERTKKKMNIKKLDDESKSIHGDSCSSNSTIQSSFWSAIESEKIDDYMSSSMLYSYQHNLSVSNNSSSNVTRLPKFTLVHEQQGDRAMI